MKWRFIVKTVQNYNFFLKKLANNHKNYYLCTEITIHLYPGVTGFDGKSRWYVSTRRLVGYLLKLSELKINWQH